MARITIYGLMDLLAIIFLIGEIAIAIISVDLTVGSFSPAAFNLHSREILINHHELVVSLPVA